MKEAYKEVQAIISESIGHETLLIPCSAHRSNKIVEHATQNSLEAKKFFDLCDKICFHNWKYKMLWSFT